jgi:uncharacterized protein
MTLDVLPARLAVCRLDAGSTVPGWALDAPPPLSITRTVHELSVMCAEDVVPGDVTARRGFRALAVRGPLDFSLPGIIAGLAGPLAGAGIAILAVATYDTDLLLVDEAELGRAVSSLRDAGHEVVA